MREESFETLKNRVYMQDAGLALFGVTGILFTITGVYDFLNRDYYRAGLEVLGVFASKGAVDYLNMVRKSNCSKITERLRGGLENI